MPTCARWMAAATPPAAVTWLSLIMTMSNSPIRWLAPPPMRTAHLSGTRRQGTVLRVSSTSALVPYRRAPAHCSLGAAALLAPTLSHKELNNKPTQGHVSQKMQSVNLKQCRGIPYRCRAEPLQGSGPIVCALQAASACIVLQLLHRMTESLPNVAPGTTSSGLGKIDIHRQGSLCNHMR